MSRTPDSASSGGGGGGDGLGGGEGDADGGGGNGDGGEGDGDGGGLATTGVVEGALEQTTAVASSLVHRCGLAEVTHARTLPANTPSDAKWA